MTFSFDSEIAALFARMGGMDGMPLPARDDVAALRKSAHENLAAAEALLPLDPEVKRRDFLVPTPDGSEILARWYERERPGSALVYFHGGGMLAGTVDLYDRFVANYVSQTGVPVLSVDYRYAPEHPGTTPAEDGFTALAWLVERADDFGLDSERIAIIGDSGGGGVAAGVGIAARDRGVRLARQILIYPMLDDRNLTPDPELAPFATWNWDNNYTGWHALLGEQLAGDDVSPLSSPSRLADFRGLAPAYIDVGELDIFRDESIRYALELYKAGVPTELHVRPGSPHGFDRVGDIEVARRSWEDRLRVIREL
jgi:acetyl esterase/lipase